MADFSDDVMRLLIKMPGRNEWVFCPQCRLQHQLIYGDKAYLTDRVGSLHWAIMHLFDDHKWTRDNIADWLEDMEDQMDLTFGGK